jgi:tRNA nucleotidyltransferase (CCA-adding enzyme)
VRRLARDNGRLDRLLRVARADHGGRGEASDPDPAFARWLEERAAALAVIDARPEPLLRGRDVLALGVPAGRAVGEALDACYEAQLDGAFADRAGALDHLARWVAARPAGDEDPS